MTIKRSEHPKKLTGQRNQCPSCLEYFTTNVGFDKHRTGSHEKQQRRCLTVAEMEAKGMKLNAHGFWILPVMEKTAKQAEWMAKRRETRKDVRPF